LSGRRRSDCSSNSATSTASGAVIPRLGCLFILVPLIELALLIQVGQWIGVWPTVALVAVTGVMGVILVRQEGVRTMARIQLELSRGQLPHRALLDGACLLVAGAFLMTPGVLTDVLAFTLLLPPARGLIQRWVVARLKRGLQEGTLHVRMQGRTTMWGESGGASPHPNESETREPDDDDEGPRTGPRPGEIVQE